MCCWTKFILFPQYFAFIFVNQRNVPVMFSFMLWPYQVLVWGQYGTGTNKHAQPWSGVNRQHTFLYMWSLETLRTVYDRAAVGKGGASVGDCTLTLRWNPWLVSTYGKQRKSAPVRTGLVFWDVWNSSPCAPTFPSLEQSRHDVLLTGWPHARSADS